MVEGNTIGIDAMGDAALPNASGVVIAASAVGNIIGGVTDAARNVISGNTNIGVDLITVGSNLVEGNYIGTDPSGTSALPNGIGVRLAGNSVVNTIGGTSAAARNVISGNRTYGVDVFLGGSNFIEGNYIGTNAAGNAALANTTAGVFLESSTNTVGGTAAGAGNLISGNVGDGILITSSQNMIQGNYIGTDATGLQALGNNRGVFARGGSTNTIGGAAPGAGNLISGNRNNAVELSQGSSFNHVVGNVIGTDVYGTAPLGNLGAGVSISGPSNTIGGTDFGAANIISSNGGPGIEIVTGGSTVVQGNLIGTDGTGTIAYPNFNGIVVDSNGVNNNNTIGGNTPGAGNVISGNTGTGVLITTNANVVQGNWIGVDSTGAQPLGNTNNGVAISGAMNNIIGGPGAGNVIAANTNQGIFLANATSNSIRGNYIGTDVTGTVALGNGDGVVLIASSNNNLIGGAQAGAGNLISGNLRSGVLLSGASTSNNQILNNHIGTDVSGTAALGNGTNGVTITNANNNSVGGTAPRAGNVIAFNGGDGVLVDGGMSDAILHNSMFANLRLGIELLNNGNHNQAAPSVTSAVSGGGVTNFNVTFTGLPSTTYTLEFFATSVRDAAGSGQGERFLGSVTVTTNASGVAQFTVSLGVEVPAGDFLLATATDPGNNTSAFGQAQQVLPA
jgi:titin